MDFEIRQDDGILIVRPKGALSEHDFVALSSAVDPYIRLKGELNALVVHTRGFPGWDSLAGLFSHVEFIRDHHEDIRRVAAVTDSKLARILQKIAGYFVQAEIRHYCYDDLGDALEWAARRK